MKRSVALASLLLTTGVQANAPTTDILVFYNNNTVSYNDAARFSDSGVSDLNSALSASTGVALRANLVGVLPLDGSTFSADMAQAKDDVKTDEVIKLWKNVYGADHIVYLSSFTNNQSLGIADVGGVTSAIDISKADSKTFAHEIGHNFGAGHQIEEGNGKYDFSHAFECDGKQTLMWSISFQSRELTFSSPSGCGNSQADNVRTIIERTDFITGRNDLRTPNGTANIFASENEIAEGDSFQVTVTRSNTSEVAGVTVKLSEGDNVFSQKLVVFQPEQLTVNIELVAEADGAYSAQDRVLVASLDYASGFDITTGESIIMVSNTDPIQKGTVALTTPASLELDQNTTHQIVVTRINGTDGDIHLALTTGGTAVAGDYTITTDTITIPDGSNRATFSINTMNTGATANKSLVLTLQGDAVSGVNQLNFVIKGHPEEVKPPSESSGGAGMYLLLLGLLGFVRKLKI